MQKQEFKLVELVSRDLQEIENEIRPYFEEGWEIAGSPALFEGARTMNGPVWKNGSVSLIFPLVREVQEK